MEEKQKPSRAKKCRQTFEVFFKNNCYNLMRIRTQEGPGQAENGFLHMEHTAVTQFIHNS